MNSPLLGEYLKEEKTNIDVSKVFTKVLCCLVILLSSLIFTSLSDKNLKIYKKYVFEDTFNFTGFKNFYESLTKKEPASNKIQMVFGSSLEYTSVVPYQDGQSFAVDSQMPLKVLSGGIVVFAGTKDGYNNTLIIQGSDGYDIWYGNLDNIDVKIYDYVNINDIVATTKDKLYLLITKDSKYYTYEEYQNQI